MLRGHVNIYVTQNVCGKSWWEARVDGHSASLVRRRRELQTMWHPAEVVTTGGAQPLCGFHWHTRPCALFYESIFEWRSKCDTRLVLQPVRFWVPV